MGFLSKLFGKKERSPDPDGIYFYVQCDHCGEKLRLRADKRHDLMRDFKTNQLIWKKEIMDARCFRLMYAEVVFSHDFQVESQTIEGQGHFLTVEEFNA